MAIELCDGAAYRISEEDGIDRGAAFSFFLNGHMDDVLLLYDVDDKYCGMITYKSLLNSSDMSEAVINEKLILEEGEGAKSFFEKAYGIMQSSSGCTLPVFSADMEILYFAKYSQELLITWDRLCKVKSSVNKESWKSFKEYKKHIHITVISDVAYELRDWLCSMGADVSVEGEAWRLLGIEETVYVDEDACIVDDEFKWIWSLFQQYTRLVESNMHDEVSELKKLLLNYTHNTEKKQIMFQMMGGAYLSESIISLILYYQQHGKDCVVVFPQIEDILNAWEKNIRNTLSLIRKIVHCGASCCSVQVPGVLEKEYDICFFCSGYATSLPSVKARYIVGLQTTATYTHMYNMKGEFERVFSEYEREKIDYLVTSEFIADWVNEKSPKWEEKILRFGYPKMDTLYHSLKEPEIPKEWYEKVKGKKAFLFTADSVSQAIWDFFDNNEDKVMIWRPHPLANEQISVKKDIERGRNMSNVIIDQGLPYYAAFQVSDALIAHWVSSVTVNYLYINKPVCILDYFYESMDDFYQNIVMDYRQEAWYKSADIAFDDNDVIEFINKVCRGEALISEEQKVYRQKMTSGFDGQVCKRIFDYFEEKES